MTLFDEVWDRAVTMIDLSDPRLRAGDVALANLLLVHGGVMNGGVLNAVDEGFSSAELERAVSGFHWFGLSEAAEVITETYRLVAEWTLTFDQRCRLEVDADNRYATAVPSDETLMETVRARVDRDPAAFAPSGTRR